MVAVGGGGAAACRVWLDGYVLERTGAAGAEDVGIAVTVAHTLMTTLADREALARCVLASADALAKATT